MFDELDEDSISVNSEQAKRINKNVSKLLKKINKPEKFSINKCFDECAENGDFGPFHSYLNLKIEKFGLISFFEKTDISPVKLRTSLKSKKPMNILLLIKILKTLNLKLFIRKG